MLKIPKKKNRYTFTLESIHVTLTVGAFSV